MTDDPRILIGGVPVECFLEQDGKRLFVVVRWNGVEERERVPRTILRMTEDERAGECARVAMPIVNKIHAAANAGVKRIKLDA